MNQYDRSRNEASLSFKMAESCCVLHSKSRVTGLQKSCVIGFRILPVHTDRKRWNQKQNRKKRETFWSLQFQFHQVYDCNSVCFFYSHWNGRFLMLPIPLPVWTSPKDIKPNLTVMELPLCCTVPSFLQQDPALLSYPSMLQKVNIKANA